MSMIKKISARLLEKKATLSTAESCTGGLVGHLLTSASASRDWYMGGVISDSNEVKQRVLGVQEETLISVGAVSAPVTEQMALGAQRLFESDYAISITSIAAPAAPNEGSPENPVGLTYIGLATPQEVIVRRFMWQGEQAYENKHRSAKATLLMLLEYLDHNRDSSTEENPMQDSAAVDVTFSSDGSIRPLRFVWKGRSMKITDWGRQWEKNGTRHFLVMTLANQIWELRFTPAELHWSIHPRSEGRRVV